MVSKALRAVGGITEILIHTGQHFSPAMSSEFIQGLGMLEPYTNLGVGTMAEVSSVAQVARIMDKLSTVFHFLNPGLVLNYGDTNSALATSLTAAKMGIPIAHVESGLRSFDMTQPEELNRIVCDHLAAYRFVPSRDALRNLKLDGINSCSYLVGDVMKDSVLAHFGNHDSSALPNSVLHDMSEGNYILLTLHRPENTKDGIALANILKALERIRPKVKVVFPVHPRTESLITDEQRTLAILRSWSIIPPVGYHDMLRLVGSARLVVTDSGGVQREAAYLGTGCVVLRKTTEWVELLEAGAATCVSPSRGVAPLLWAFRHGLKKRKAPPPPYGNGRAAIEIADIIKALGLFLLRPTAKGNKRRRKSP